MYSLALKIIKSFACQTSWRRAPFVAGDRKGKKRESMDEFFVHLGVPITPCALQIRCGPPTRSTQRDGPIGRAFRCFNGSLLSITIGFMDEQVPRYGELSAWLLARAGMTFPLRRQRIVRSWNDRFFVLSLITTDMLLQRTHLECENDESCLSSETTRDLTGYNVERHNERQIHFSL